MGASRIYVPSTVLDVYLCVCCVTGVVRCCSVERIIRFLPLGRGRKDQYFNCAWSQRDAT